MPTLRNPAIGARTKHWLARRENKPTMNTFNHILYVMDPESNDAWAIRRVRTFAEESQAALTFLLVLDLAPASASAANESDPEPLIQEIRRQCAARTQEVLADSGGSAGIRFEVRFGRLHVEVIRQAMSGGHDLVVKASEDPDPKGRPLGSRDMHLLRKCPQPVWLLRKDGPERYRTLLVAIDPVPADEDPEGHALNREILSRASALALADLAELHLVHAWDAPAAGLLRHWNASAWALNPIADEVRYIEDLRSQHQLRLSGVLGDLREILGPETFEYLAVRSHLARGAAAQIIPALATELGADIIVMGTLGRSGIPGLLIGNTAETIANRCDCALMAIKPPGFEPPAGLLP
ncbi:universal stress protein [Thiorhodococcus fuscus]|uniref:Universal stress protein n=1 Tax=Thiorhodococcus fuscus TaxID=527200 RepID=A0ABW4Y3M4_9GAMM